MATSEPPLIEQRPRVLSLWNVHSLCGGKQKSRRFLVNTIQRLSIHEAGGLICQIADSLAVINLGSDTVIETALTITT
jgi:hypothetical protein